MSTVGFFFSLQLALAQFLEVSQKIGIDHYHKDLSRMGGGATFFDFDNDGFPDLFLTGGLKRDKLYRNLGNGTFQDVSEATGLENVAIVNSSGVVVGDINNDGCEDLFISTFEPYANQLLLNKCDGTFSDISVKANITEISSSTGAVFIDVNEDGYLDIYVVNYVETPGYILNENGSIVGFDHDCYANFLYVNQGNSRFVEKAAAFGVDHLGCGLAVAATDINGDGHTDLYIANDFGEWVLPNEAYLNLSPGLKFTPLGKEYGLDAALYGMGIAIGDPDENGLKDYYVTNLGHNRLLTQNPMNQFTETARELGISNGFVKDQRVTSWGTLFFDANNDRHLDLFVANGSVSGLEFLNTLDRDPDKLFINDGKGSFASYTPFDSIASNQSNRGAVVADYDLDGDLDIYSVAVDVSDVGGSFGSFYQNLTDQGNWVSLKLVGTSINKNAYGSSVRLFAQTYVADRELYSGGTYASQSGQELHFGLGDLAKVDSIRVSWTGDSRPETLYNLPVNQRLRIEQGTGSFRIMGCTTSSNVLYNREADYHTACQSTSLLSTETEPESEFVVFPACFTGSFWIKLPDPGLNYELTVRNVHGQKVLSVSIPGGCLSPFKIDAYTVPAGLYLVECRSNEQVSNYKIIKLN